MSDKVKEYLKELKTIKEKQLKGHTKAIEMVKNTYNDIELSNDKEIKNMYYKAITKKENLKRDIQELEKILKEKN